MNKFELTARFDSRKSFYKKAWIIEDNDTLTLQSYDTLIARISKRNGILQLIDDDENDYTVTTMRHLVEFSKQYVRYDESMINNRNDFKNMYKLQFAEVTE